MSIELMRRLELLENPSATAPQTPREAVMRYFSLPPLDQLPRMTTPIKGTKPREYARELAKRIRIQALYGANPLAGLLLFLAQRSFPLPGVMLAVLDL